MMGDLKRVREALAGTFPREELDLGAVARLVSEMETLLEIQAERAAKETHDGNRA